MLTQHNKLSLAAAAVAATLASTSATALAQSADALIDKLVDKGVLTVKEANDLREEADKNFATAYSAKSGMPDWVSSFKINGDFRGRYDGIFVDNPAFVERDRFRYRARIGFTAVMQDNFEVGLRLGSGDLDSAPANNSGFNPLTQNQTLQNNASKKGILIDLAYGKWTAVKTPDWLISTTIGKMENPYVFSDMIFDPDYTPEGAAFQLSHSFGEHNTVKVNSGAFVLDELANTTQDPFMYGTQARLDSVWSPKFSTSLGGAYLAIVNPNQLINTAVPNVNVGNTRNGAGALVYNYTPFIADASATWTLGSFPMYPGAFPIKFGGDYIKNPGAPSSSDNDGWSAGVTFGKAGKKDCWELAYTYRWLGANAWWEEVVDDDFGAYYASAPLNGGTGAGYFGGTNTKGHIVKLSYSPTDSLTLSAKFFLTELINTGATALSAPIPADVRSDTTRLQVDAMWKF
jgi:hypothetical protein